MSDSDIDVVNVSNSDEEPGPSKSKKCRRSYTITQKIEVIDFAKSNSISAASRRFKVTRSTVYDWLRQERELRTLLLVSRESKSTTND